MVVDNHSPGDARFITDINTVIMEFLYIVRVEEFSPAGTLKCKSSISAHDRYKTGLLFILQTRTYDSGPCQICGHQQFARMTEN